MNGQKLLADGWGDGDEANQDLIEENIHTEMLPASHQKCLTLSLGSPNAPLSFHPCPTKHLPLSSPFAAVTVTCGDRSRPFLHHSCSRYNFEQQIYGTGRNVKTRVHEHVKEAKDQAQGKGTYDTFSRHFSSLIPPNIKRKQMANHIPMKIDILWEGNQSPASRRSPQHLVNSA